MATIPVYIVDILQYPPLPRAGRRRKRKYYLYWEVWPCYYCESGSCSIRVTLCSFCRLTLLTPFCGNPLFWASTPLGYRRRLLGTIFWGQHPPWVSGQVAAINYFSVTEYQICRLMKEGWVSLAPRWICGYGPYRILRWMYRLFGTGVKCVPLWGSNEAAQYR
jgi:hypothetical protein